MSTGKSATAGEMDLTSDPAWSLINQQREQIDQIDQEILQLLNQRALHVLEIGRHKRTGSLPTVWPQRERQILDCLRGNNRGPLPDDSLEMIFREVICACRNLQRPLQVAYLGPEHTFSHQAVLGHFGGSCQSRPLATIADVFDQVGRGGCQVGLVPVENSSEGGVSVTLDQFLTSDLKVCGEIYTPVNHVLMSSEASLEDIRTVYSHPQGLNQCRQWLARNLPNAKTVESASTAKAAEIAAGQPGSAAVGSELAARHQGLKVLAKDIQDIAHNSTRFLVLGKQNPPPCGNDKTSLLMVVAHRAGSLHRALDQFASRGINLTRIESRPTRDRPWEYAFFVDFEGHVDDEPVGQALAALTPEVEVLKVLGSYPASSSGVRL